MKPQGRTDVQAAIIKGRRIPCICERQDTRAPSVTGYSTSRGIVIATVECTRCFAAWRRIDCK